MTSLALCGSLLILYLLVLLKSCCKAKARHSQFNYLIILFMISQVAWILANYEMTRFYRSLGCQNDPTEICNSDDFMIISFGVYDSTYSVAHWVFAAHYYTNAIRIELISRKQSPESNQLKMNILFWSLVGANVLLPLVEELNLFPEL